MNKAVLALVAVAGVAGGSYYFLPNDVSNNIKQYLPESVTSFLGDSPVVETVAIESEEITTTESVAVETQAFATEAVTTMTNAVENVQGNVEQVAQDVTETVSDTVQTASSAVEQVVTESLENEKIKAEAEVKDQAVADNSPEVIKLQKELGDMNKSISQLDQENMDLQNMFKEMLSKNKDLAIKLSQMDKELNSAN